jgi:signal transduction histidine kinase
VTRKAEVRQIRAPAGRENPDKRSQSPRNEYTFAASVAHEINNPLQSLINLLYLIRTTASLSEESRHYLQLAQEEAQRVSWITHSAMNRFQHPDHPMRANVPELVDSVVKFYRSRFNSQGISVRTQYWGDGNLAVYLDPLRQMFSNLLLNAADAMPEGGTIRARVSPAHEWVGGKRHGLRVTIADTGCGIPEHDLPAIMASSFTTKGRGGNGVGLSVVKDTVERHGGALHVKSSTKPGRTGTVFSVFLPAA